MVASLTLVWIALLAFLATNLDDLVVLTTFAGHESYSRFELLVGQYLGFGALVFASVVAGVGLAGLIAAHVRWLGIAPVVIGVHWLWRETGRSATTNGATTDGPLTRIGTIAGVGVANGGDNIAVYVPLVAVLDHGATAFVVSVFLVVAGGWVLLADWLAGRPVLADRVGAHGDVLVPVVLIALGVSILAGLI